MLTLTPPPLWLEAGWVPRAAVPWLLTLPAWRLRCSAGADPWLAPAPRSNVEPTSGDAGSSSSSSSGGAAATPGQGLDLVPPHRLLLELGAGPAPALPAGRAGRLASLLHLQLDRRPADAGPRAFSAASLPPLPALATLHLGGYEEYELGEGLPPTLRTLRLNYVPQQRPDALCAPSLPPDLQ